MRVSYCAAFLARLSSLPGPVLGLPVDHAQSPAATPNPDWAPGWSFTLPPILKRDDAVKPVCDWTCTHRILYQTAYSAVSSGIEYAMVTYDAQGWCFEQESAWCPQIVESQTTAIAARSSYMEISYGACDEPCLLISMAEVARKGALYGMQWAEQAFPPDAGSVGEDAIQKLLWTMWYLSENYPSITGGALDGGHAQSWNTTTSNATSTSSGNDTSTSSSNSSTSLEKAPTEITSSRPATNLLAEYVTSGGACSDPYLCQVDNYMQISSVMKKAQSSVNGSTWLGFMLAGGESGDSGRKATFPTYASRPPCTGSPPPPDVGPQKPPPDWTPERIPEPPANPDAPEIPREPTPPQEDEGTKRRLKEADEKQLRKAREREQEQTKEKCGDDEICTAKEDRKHDEERKVKEQDEAERNKLEDEARKVEEEHYKKDPEEVEAKCKGNEACERDERQKKDDERKVREQKAGEEAQDLQNQQAARKECKGKEPCMDDKLREMKEEREVQDEKNRKADEALEKQIDEKIKSDCGGDKHCEELGHANEKTRQKAEEYEDRTHDLERPEHSPLRHGDATHFNEFDAPNVQPRPVPELDEKARFRAQVYDSKTGTMEQLEVEDLRLHGTEEARVLEEWGMTSPRIETLRNAGLRPVQLLKNGVPMREAVWVKKNDLISMTESAWEKAGDNMFKIGDGKVAINALGEPIVAGPSMSPPRTLRPEPPEKGVSSDGKVKYTFDAEDPDKPGEKLETTKEIEFDSHAAHPEVPGTPDQPGVDEGDAKHRGKDPTDVDGHRANGRKPQAIPGPAYQYPQAKHWDVSNPGSGYWPAAHPLYNDPAKVPQRMNPHMWPPPNTDGADDWDLLDEEGIKELKNGQKGKLPKAGKYPKVAGFGGITSMARWTQKASASLTLTGPLGWLVMFGAMGASEFLMFSQAEGNADVWWHCVKERVNIAGVHVCGMVDENGNEIIGKDEGPFKNFLRNYYGWLIPEDIDGDGRLENPFEKFVAGMQNLGENIYDFFDSSEDGTGVVENTWTIFRNGFKTIVHVMEDGAQWFEEKAEKVVDVAEKALDKVKGWISSAWDWLTGDDDDEDDDD